MASSVGWLFSMTVFNPIPDSLPYRSWKTKQLCQSPFQLGVAMRHFQPEDMSRK